MTPENTKSLVRYLKFLANILDGNKPKEIEVPKVMTALYGLAKGLECGIEDYELEEDCEGCKDKNLLHNAACSRRIHNWT